ncbi:hypothetical protein AGMMS50256_24800 [Betaproteobacteria bacterium]|nr:hypothetical protein AGMMS50256_24800 [Betaproteobacteria bacterium]
MVMVSVSQIEEEGFISSQEAERVLGIFCVKYGFCLPSLWHARLRDCPPHSIAKFTDTVFHAEGLDPRTADRAMYKGMLEEVRLAFERSNATGGMPSNSAITQRRSRTLRK